MSLDKIAYLFTIVRSESISKNCVRSDRLMIYYIGFQAFGKGHIINKVHSNALCYKSRFGEKPTSVSFKVVMNVL